MTAESDWAKWLEEERKRIEKLILGEPEDELVDLMRKRTATFKTDPIDADNLHRAFFGTEPGSVLDWAAKHRKINPWAVDKMFPLKVPPPAPRPKGLYRYQMGAKSLREALRPAPTRTEVIKAVWAEVEHFWDAKAGPDGLLAVCHGMGTFDFKVARYGDERVIECEGVIVQRTRITTVDIG